ncbi:MAG: HPF/RaiA family ribosome-associated protein [bacterium]|nr:HPF/RaiA family ribosome-associated protein [bacterium]
MNIIIKTTGLELASEARERIETKFRALEKHLGEHRDTALLDCEVEESIAAVRAGARYRAEGNLAVGGKLLRAEAMNDTLEGAVDQVRDELMRELRKSRGRERGLAKRGGAVLKRLLRTTRALPFF